MSNKSPPEKSQFDWFIETTHALECDEDEAAFKAKLAGIVQQTPTNEPKATVNRRDTKHD